MRYVLDRGVRRSEAGRTLLGGDPVRVVRLSEGGARVVEPAGAEGWQVDESSAAQRRLRDRLVAAQMLHPMPVPVDAARVEELAVVVPVRDRPEALGRCLRSLRASGVDRIVVVDDGSADAGAHASAAAASGARLLRIETSLGPAGARTAGLAAAHDWWADADCAAVVDSDIEVTPGWASTLLGHFDDPAVGAVAPRVRHSGGDPRSGVAGVVDRYEAANSPLDLGDRPARIMAGTRVSYVPAAALLVRWSALADVGGFDATLTVGEDVDLLWRLADGGWECRYDPRAEVAHRGRSRLEELLARRVDYGTSAALLERRHRGRLAPVRTSSWSVAVVGAAATGHPVVATAVAGWTVRSLAERLGDRPVDGRVALASRLTLAGHLGAARQFARAIVRPWWPLTLGLVLLGRSARMRRFLLVPPVAVALEAWVRRRPRVDPVRWTALWLADDVAYSAGVWWGCIRLRESGPLLPEVSGRLGTAARQN